MSTHPSSVRPASLPIHARPRRALAGERRATVAILVGFLIPILLLVAGLVVDATVWTLGSTRLQLAADAAATSALITAQTSAFQSEASARQQSDLQAIINFEVAAAGSRLAGAISTTPSITYDTSKYTSVTLTLTSQAPSFFGGASGVSAPVLKASATATMATPSGSGAQPAAPCVLMLGTTGVGINLDNSGSIVGSGCAVFTDSTAAASITVNSGTLNGSTIGTSGTTSLSNSGSNSINQPIQTNQARVKDPNAGASPPAPGACNAASNNYTAYGTYSLTPVVFCGDVTIGGNGSTISFAPGIYYVVNGSLTFNNASIGSASGVTFVLTGSSPGSFSYTNYSNTTVMSAPTTGATAGYLVWQVCNKSTQQQDSFQGGSTLQVTGLIYAPCASIDVGNNAQLTGPLNGSFNVIGQSIYVHGSASVHTSTVATTAPAKPALTN